MTAIVGVLNRHAAAIAADSAVTIAGKKVFNSANKVFALSKYEPIAIAMYNNSELIGTSWEIIIKEFRKHLDKTVKSSIKGYADEFFSLRTSIILLMMLYKRSSFLCKSVLLSML